MACLDELTRFNQERWNALVRAGVRYSRPFLDLDEAAARAFVDPYGVMGDVSGKSVLCLAGGGGQQSVIFNLLGAGEVTVLDFSEAQLENDRKALDHYGFDAALFQGDMRDLSRFADASFDLVFHAYSINFIPEIDQVFDEIGRVLRLNGLYRVEWSNPFGKSVDDRKWTEAGYPINVPYGNQEMVFEDDAWDVDAGDGEVQRVEGPREFNHMLSSVVNGLIQRNLMLLGIWEDQSGEFEAEPGSWDHFKAILPPYLTVWAKKVNSI